MPGGTVIAIEDPADPRLSDYADLPDAALRDREATGARGVFIAEGELVVRSLAASRFPVRSILVTPGRLEGCRDVVNALPPGTPVYVLPQGLMERAVGYAFHRGVMGVGERLPPPTLEAVTRLAGTLLLLEDLSNADNVGAVFRNAAALAGPDAAVLLSPGCCDPLYRKAVRVSMGHALRLPFRRCERWPDELDDLRRLGWTVLGLTPRPEAPLVRDAARGAAKIAWLLGAEGPGLTDRALAKADAWARIPMQPGADSLNVATAAAVALALRATDA